MVKKKDVLKVSALSLMLTLAVSGVAFTQSEFDACAATVVKANRSTLATPTPSVPQPSGNAHWESSDGYNWKYRKADGSYATGWLRDEATNDWYYMDAQGNMRTGVISDGGYEYMLSNTHDGRYGHMLRNGESYDGKVISAWTAGSGHPEGALRENIENDSAIGGEPDSANPVSSDDDVAAAREWFTRSGGENEEVKQEILNNTEFLKQWWIAQQNRGSSGANLIIR